MDNIEFYIKYVFQVYVFELVDVNICSKKIKRLVKFDLI